ncbi:hypothetical protein FRC17_004526, partial [Serendipita sp. 399]
ELSRTSHPPAVFQNGHGAEVDLWCVGKLLEAATSNFHCKIHPDLKQIGARMIANDINSATQALQEIKALNIE